MSYNDGNFYHEYSDYLKEPRVRKVHDKMFVLFGNLLGSSFSSPVADLGCGKNCEYGVFSSFSLKGYFGFDINVEERKTKSLYYTNETFKLDYRKEIDSLIEIANEKKVGKFVSLFSSEITASPVDNQALYEKLFLDIPSLTHGMVSGFYYSENKENQIIDEAGGIKSWQTFDSIEDNKSEIYDEMRVIEKCPSNMFGEDVVEIWKILTKRQNNLSS